MHVNMGCVHPMCTTTLIIHDKIENKKKEDPNRIEYN
jgi:hypothetical protein